jgi:hypothetical protein
MTKQKKPRKPRDKQKELEDLAHKLGSVVIKTKGKGNPFKDLVLTDRERELLAEAGIV